MTDPVASAADAFYEQLTPDTFRATPATTGPWDPSLQHGGPPIALLGRALERQGGPPGSRIARIAVDFFSPVPVAEMSIRATVLRPGRRIQVSEAVLSAAGRVVLRVTGAHVLAADGRSPVVADPFIVPALPAEETRVWFPGLENFQYGDAIEWRFAEGRFDRPGPATVWTRCRIPLVQGGTLTGLERVLIMVDAANGISAELPIAQWTFVPIDLMATFQRMAEGEWVGMSSRTTVGGAGIGTTETILFDRGGAIGRALQTLYVEPR
jgi:hypothetical protein